jgi:hypothetical protein
LCEQIQQNQIKAEHTSPGVKCKPLFVKEEQKKGEVCYVAIPVPKICTAREKGGRSMRLKQKQERQ